MKKIYILIFLALVCIVASGCGDGCEEEGKTKCRDGMLYQCVYYGSGMAPKYQWHMRLDCNEFAATCKEGNYQSQLPPYSTNNQRAWCNYNTFDCGPFYPSPFEKYEYYNVTASVYDHMCVSNVHECTGTGHLECTEDNQAIVNCEDSPEGPVPVIIAIIPLSGYSYTECVEGETGLSFAYMQGTCEVGDRACYGGERRHSGCSSNGFWQYGSGICPEGTTCYQVNEKEIEWR
jgi:hypothetical protein